MFKLGHVECEGQEIHPRGGDQWVDECKGPGDGGEWGLER